MEMHSVRFLLMLCFFSLTGCVGLSQRKPVPLSFDHPVQGVAMAQVTFLIKDSGLYTINYVEAQSPAKDQEEFLELSGIISVENITQIKKTGEAELPTDVAFACFFNKYKIDMKAKEDVRTIGIHAKRNDTLRVTLIDDFAEMANKGTFFLVKPNTDSVLGLSSPFMWKPVCLDNIPNDKDADVIQLEMLKEIASCRDVVSAVKQFVPRYILCKVRKKDPRLLYTSGWGENEQGKVIFFEGRYSE